MGFYWLLYAPEGATEASKSHFHKLKIVSENQKWLLGGHLAEDRNQKRGLLTQKQVLIWSHLNTRA